MCRGGPALNRNRAIVIAAGDDRRPDDHARIGNRTQRHNGTEFIANVDLPKR